MRYTAVLLLAIFSAACAVGPNYRRPSVPVPETFRAPRNESKCAPSNPGKAGARDAAYLAYSFSKYDWKNASCASEGACAPSGGLPNSLTVAAFPS